MAAASLILEGGLSNPNPVLYTSSQKSPDVCQDPIINEIFGEFKREMVSELVNQMHAVMRVFLFVLSCRSDS